MYSKSYNSFSTIRTTFSLLQNFLFQPFDYQDTHCKLCEVPLPDLSVTMVGVMWQVLKATDKIGIFFFFLKEKWFFTQEKLGYLIKSRQQIQRVPNKKHAREHTSIRLCFGILYT